MKKFRIVEKDGVFHCEAKTKVVFRFWKIHINTMRYRPLNRLGFILQKTSIERFKHRKTYTMKTFDGKIAAEIWLAMIKRRIGNRI